MDPTINTTPSNPSPSNSSGKGKLILVIVIVGIIIFSLLSAFLFFKDRIPGLPGTAPTTPPSAITEQQALSENGLFPQDEVFATVGEEEIFGSDLNFIAYTYYNTEYNKLVNEGQPAPETLKDNALQKAINDSVILQEGAKDNLVLLTTSIFNYPQKDFWARQMAVQNVEDAYNASQQTYSGESITIWFYNVQPPKVSETEAEQIAKEKITELYNDLLANRITMKEAGDRIKQDTELAQIDFNYKGNAYYEFKDSSLQNPPFSKEEKNKATFALGNGQMSGIIRVPAQGKGSDPREEYYTIVKVNEITPGNATVPFNTWLETVKEEYTINTP